MPFFRKIKAFTLIELLIVMAIIAVLLTLISPRYHIGVERAKEAVLKQNLHTLREVIDKYYSDQGSYPTQLSLLVEKKYLRGIPVDPITESADTWVLTIAENVGSEAIVDVHSGAEGIGQNGIPFREW